MGTIAVLPQPVYAAGNDRSFVSGSGNDANTCTRDAPCRTFQAAYERTFAGGEINCLDTADFGAVTISRAFTIDCTENQGAITNPGNISAGITVNAGNDSRVLIRGLSITAGPNNSSGIQIGTAAAVTVQDVKISGFGYGIQIAASTPSQVQVANVILSGNGYGIAVIPRAASPARVGVTNSRILNSRFEGLIVFNDQSNYGQGVVVTVEGGLIDSNESGVRVTATETYYAPGVVQLNGVTISNNRTAGVLTTGPIAFARLSGSTVIGNGVGLSRNQNSTIASFGGNRVYGNSDNGTFNQILPGQ